MSHLQPFVVGAYGCPFHLANQTRKLPGHVSEVLRAGPPADLTRTGYVRAVPNRNADLPPVIGDNSNVVTTVISFRRGRNLRNHCRRIPFGAQWRNNNEKPIRSPQNLIGRPYIQRTNTRLYLDKQFGQQKYPWTHKYICAFTPTQLCDGNLNAVCGLNLSLSEKVRFAKGVRYTVTDLKA